LLKIIYVKRILHGFIAKYIRFMNILYGSMGVESRKWHKTHI